MPIGLSVSWIMTYVITPDVFAQWIGLEQGFTRRESVDVGLMLMIVAHLIITAGFFCATTLFYKPQNDAHRVETDRFFKDIETPVIADFEQDDYDRQQRNKLGLMVIIMSVGMVAMMAIPNPMWGRLVFLGCALVMFAIGCLLKFSARPDADNPPVQGGSHEHP